MKIHLMIFPLVGISISIVAARRIFVKQAHDELYANTYFTNALETFSNNLYKAATNGKAENMLLSPLSVNLVLAMIASGAKGSTKREMLKTLHLPEIDNNLTDYNYGPLYYYLLHDANSKLTIKNNLFISNHLKVKRSFIDAVLRFFYGRATVVNFDNTQKALTQINTWAANETNGKIKDIVDSSNLSPDTNLVVANVIYFKDDWKYTFNSVEIADFYPDSDEQSYNVDMMHQRVTVDFGYAPEINAKFVELPYKNNGLKMIIIVPVGRNSLEQVERILETMTLKNLRTKRSNVEVDVHLPKFKIESTFDLNKILQEMGTNEAFHSQADFSGIAEEHLSLSNVKQKTIIEVNEYGTEASAATAASMETRFGSSTEEFLANRPFHFKIIKTLGDDDGIVLFAGNYKSPN